MDFVMPLFMSPCQCWRLAVAAPLEQGPAMTALRLMALISASVVWTVGEACWHLRFIEVTLHVASVAAMVVVFRRVFQGLHLPHDTASGTLKRSCLVVAPFFVIWIGAGAIILLAIAALQTASDRFMMHWPMLVGDVVILPGLLFQAVWTLQRRNRRQ